MVKIILATLVVTLSILLTYQDNKVIELEKQNTYFENELNYCNENAWWVDKLEQDILLLEDKLEEYGFVEN